MSRSFIKVSKLCGVCLVDMLYCLLYIYYYSAKEVLFWLVSICLSVSGSTGKVNVQLLYVKACMIMDFCFGKNLLYLGVDTTQNGRLSEILDFCYIAFTRISLKMMF